MTKTNDIYVRFRPVSATCYHAKKMKSGKITFDKLRLFDDEADTKISAD